MNNPYILTDYYVYKPRNLKIQFAELDEIDESALIPLVDFLFFKWIDYTQKDSSITDMKKNIKIDDPIIQDYVFILDGKIVNVKGNNVNINYSGASGGSYNVGSISFEGKTAKQLLTNFQTYIGKHNLTELIKSVTEELKDKRSNLQDSIIDFYF